MLRYWRDKEDAALSVECEVWPIIGWRVHREHATPICPGSWVVAERDRNEMALIKLADGKFSDTAYEGSLYGQPRCRQGRSDRAGRCWVARRTGQKGCCSAMIADRQRSVMVMRRRQWRPAMPWTTTPRDQQSDDTEEGH